MLKVIIIYILIIVISFIIGLNMGLINIKCINGICPQSGEHKSGSDYDWNKGEYVSTCPYCKDRLEINKEEYEKDNIEIYFKADS